MEAAVILGKPSERGSRLKASLHSAPPEIDIERARHFTRVWREMEDGPPCTRAAKALQSTLRNMTIRICDNEQIVGVKTKKKVAEAWPVERDSLFNDILDVLVYQDDRGLKKGDEAFI